MIIFFDKKTGQVYGTVEGRVHEDTKDMMIKPGHVKETQVGKYMVPFKPVYKIERVPIEKWFVKDLKTGEVEKRIVGTERRKVGDGMVPDVKFAKLILAFEAGSENIYDYRVRLDKNKKVIGFIKK